MDDAQELSSSPHNAGGLKKVFTRSSRSQTTHAQDVESNHSSARSNGRSSFDSTPDKRPATAGGELTVEESPKRLSKLLGSRRKKKNNNNNSSNEKHTDSTPSTDSLAKDDDGTGPFPSLPADEYAISQSDGNGAGLGNSNVSINLLTDESEPDK